MRNALIVSTILFAGLSTAPSFAAGVAKETDTKAPKTKAAMPVCPTGTKADDGKYYLPGTHEECRLSDKDHTDTQHKSK
ncbi:hypothetical protein JAU75_07515 [Ochrobactrum sp. Q0168]|uniref:hypothetical protein n=1 Tax=Ochrobactrum sp. Q0168 TaxID=2793241 RepID=UPI0018EC35D8|nr:hypothetical protein [Ochrobactrum sp. Q0168]